MLIFQPSPALLDLGHCWMSIDEVALVCSWNCHSSSAWTGTGAQGWLRHRSSSGDSSAAQEVTELSQGAISPCIVPLGPWQVTPAPGKLEFPALVIWNPSDALLWGWKRSWGWNSFPSSWSFLWCKQTAGVCFPTQGQFINKFQRFVAVFINFVQETNPQDGFAQHLAQLGLDLSRNIHVQVLLFSFLIHWWFPSQFSGALFQNSRRWEQITWRNSWEPNGIIWSRSQIWIFMYFLKALRACGCTVNCK